MHLVYFTHSLSSCWNHGNAHFLRGVLRELVARGHDVSAYEPDGGWSRQNLIADAGLETADAWQSWFPELSTAEYAKEVDPADLVRGADVVVVHEWNDPSLVARLGDVRRDDGRFLLLFHDTHHRAVSDPDAMAQYDLTGYDGVLAFGEALAAVYRERGFAERVFVWHEAADTKLFRPPGAGARARGRGLDRQLGRRRAYGGARGIPVRTHGRAASPARRARRPLSRRGPGHARALRRALPRLAAQLPRARRSSPSIC